MSESRLRTALEEIIYSDSCPTDLRVTLENVLELDDEINYMDANDFDEYIDSEDFVDNVYELFGVSI